MVSGDGKMIDVVSVSGLGEWTQEKKGEDVRFLAPNGKVFLVERPKTIEVRCDGRLGKTLRDEYESVMGSRYFGRGGIEIVPSGQLSREEIADLVRLRYNLTQEMGND